MKYTQSEIKRIDKYILYLNKLALNDIIISFAYMISKWTDCNVKPYNFAEWIYNKQLMQEFLGENVKPF